MRILYNSLELQFKTPFGTLVPGQSCQMRLAIPVACQTQKVWLRLEQEDGKPAFRVPCAFTQEKDQYEWYKATFEIQDCGLYFYYFTIQTAHETFSLFAQGENTNMESGDKWQLSCVCEQYPVPAYAKGAVMYQIFPDRFYQQGEPDLTGKLDPYWIHTDLHQMPEYRPDDRGEVKNCDFYGGNFQGIQAKLPYLQQLGVSILYLNPIFKAYSNHRYDTCDYLQPDPMLGTAEDFSALCQAAHAGGMRIILDGVFSHTGSDSVYFDRKNRFGHGACSGPDSPYYGWYTFDAFPNRYTSWWGIDTLPCVNKMEESYLQFVIDQPDSVVAHWLNLGADGFRLDVVDELPDAFVARLKRRIRQIKPDALLIGEVWEDASNKIAYGKRRRYFVDGELDSVMNYPWRTAILRFCLGQDDGTALKESVMRIAENYPQPVLDCTMNILGTHDTPRILTMLGTTCDGSKQEQARRLLDPAQKQLAVQRLKLAAFLQFVLPGMPCIYYADEVGMQGCSDPFNRQYYPWDQQDVSLLQYYQALAQLKTRQPALRQGTICEFIASNKQVRFWRKTSEEQLQICCNASERPMDADGRILFGVNIAWADSKKAVLQPGGFCVCKLEKNAENSCNQSVQTV